VTQETQNWRTYGLGDGGVHLQSAVESDVAVAQLRPDSLTSSDLFVRVSIRLESYSSCQLCLHLCTKCWSTE
jgi:hypothetical protein